MTFYCSWVIVCIFGHSYLLVGVVKTGHSVHAALCRHGIASCNRPSRHLYDHPEMA